MSADQPTPQQPDPDQAPPPEIPEDQLKIYMSVWGTAWASGYVSAIASAAANGGMPDEPRAALALSMESRARHLLDRAIEDPVTRHVIVDIIQRLVANDGRPQAHQGELAIPCDHEECRTRREQDGRSD